MALETFVRYVGWALQVAALSIAAYGITETRKQWAPDRPGTVTKVRGSLRRMRETLLVRLHVRRPTDTLLAVDDARHDHWAAQAGMARVTYPAPPEDATVEDRLAVLEQRIQQLAQRDNELTNSLAEKDRETSEAIAAERAARDGDVARLDQGMRDLAAGGLRLEAFALFLLVVGITLGTVPEGLAWIFRGLWSLP